MLKQVQHDKKTQSICQPELVSGSPEMLKQVQHDKNEQVRKDKKHNKNP